jgi:hypothetical protein
MSEFGEFTCALCKGIFEKGWSDEAAMKEMTDVLGEVPEDEPLDIVCDDCFNEINPRKHPEIIDATKAIFAARKLGITDGQA